MYGKNDGYQHHFGEGDSMKAKPVDLEELKAKLLEDFAKVEKLQAKTEEDTSFDKHLNYSATSKAAKQVFLQAVSVKAEIVKSLTAIETEQREAALQKKRNPSLDKR